MGTRIRGPDYSKVSVFFSSKASFPSSFSLSPLPPPSLLLGKHASPPWTNDTRDDESVRENEAFLHRVYDANDEF